MAPGSHGALQGHQERDTRDISSNTRDREQRRESCLISTFLCSTAPGAPSRRPWSHSTPNLELRELILGLFTLHGTKLQLSP